MKLCPGKANVEWKWIPPRQRKFSHYWGPDIHSRTRTKRIKCELCGRRLVVPATLINDGDYWRWQIPPHKPKGWWKKTRSKQ